jgi:transcriptional regulator with GAF, ATPase, and Fis domain
VISWQDPPTSTSAIAHRLLRWDAVDELIQSALVEDNLVGRSACWIQSLRRIIEPARFTDSNILLLGESGTGKEQAARLIHTIDSRVPKGELVVVDCTTIVPELAGSEFFGHERGAFTGAVGQRDGAFALAHGGTLFVDEIGELSLPLQSQLLRVVQERTFKRVGGNTWFTTQFRLVCATNRNLLELVAQGAFRRDLYYRIASSVCTLPALRDRVEDIPVLAAHFLRELSPRAMAPELDHALHEWLLRRPYPGNVRDLRQVVSRMLSSYAGIGPVTAGCLPAEERPEAGGKTCRWDGADLDRVVTHAVAQGVPLKDIGHAAHEAAIRAAVALEQGSLQRAAVRLHVSDRLLQMRRAGWRKRTAPDAPLH